MNSIEFTIKQHTPLIHFQHEPGATLRATELKPKLDKYLLENCQIRDEWRKSQKPEKKAYKALDYKVRIDAQTEEPTPIAKGQSIPSFFANMGDEYDKHPKQFSITKKPLNLTITSFQEGLLDQIKANFPDFLFRTNFGTRQSKGFGAFLTENIEDSVLKSTPRLVISRRQVNDYKDLMNIINYYYQRLKSGINYREHYRHAFLKLYLENKGYRWEKRWLKEKFIGGLTPLVDDQRYARAMLGIGGAYSFKPMRGRGEAGQVYPKRELDIKVESTVEDVVRFKSPITFKPVDHGSHWSIYIHAHPIPAALENVGFKFSTSGGKEYPLNTPSKALNISDLISSYHQHLGKEFKAMTYTGNPSYQVKVDY